MRVKGKGKSTPTKARALRFSVQRRVTSTRREMYRQLSPLPSPVKPMLLKRKKAMLAQLGDGCVYCGRKANTQDHLEPLVADGMPTGLIATELDMLPCCSSCNSSKGARKWRIFMNALRAPACDHSERVKWLMRYDRWRQRHAQRWDVSKHMATIVRLNRMVNDAHAFMQQMVNECTQQMHGKKCVQAYAQPCTLQWDCIRCQLMRAQ